MTVALVANIARPISSAISTAFSADSYGLLSSYGLLGASANPDAVIEALFANSEVGAWYDPSDLSTMFQDRAGTTPVTADGQTVGKILDKSGRGNHAVAPSDAARPLYKTDGTYHWLQFDGVDDSLSTAAIDFTSTDEMSVFSGLKKSSASLSVAVELSPDAVNNGSFVVFAPLSAGNYSTRVKGTINSSITSANTYVEPIKNTLTVLAEIGTDTHILRLNAVQAGSLSGDIGAGNFGTWPLYIGRRAGTSFALNGNIYSLIVRGALSTPQEITDTETWVNSKCGAF